jgi:acylphosphatase
MQVTCHMRVFGRVQGVGYRESMRIEAERSGCTGWVRNRADRSVEAMVQGPAEAVERLVAWAKQGPPSARVERIEVGPGQGAFTSFEVLRTA